MKKFLIWWITFTRWDEIIFLFTLYYKGELLSLVFGGTHLVYLLQVKYFVIRKGRKKGVNHW